MSLDKFKYDLMTLNAAGVAVILVRTREPLRAVDALRQTAALDGGQYVTWDREQGALEHDLTTLQGAEKPYPNSSENFAADLLGMLRHIGALPEVPPEDERTKRIFFSIIYPHWEIMEMPPIVQMLVNYCELFTRPTIRRTLFLVVPENFTLPLELSDCVTVMDFVVPNHEELQECVLNLFAVAVHEDEDGNVVRPELTEDDIEALASACAGMTRKGAEDALARVLTRRIKDFPDFDLPSFCADLSAIKAEVVRKSEVLEVMQPEPIERIGGLQELKTYIQDRTLAFTPEAREFGVVRPRGIALIGPPGTGKTLGGKVIASSLNRPLVRFDISKVFDGLVGGSEAKTRSALAMLRAMAPCVCMVDEVDKVFNVNSGGGDSGVGTRVLGMILTELQESDADVYWVMTANRTDGLPPELLRKGRLDELFAVSVPNASERLEVLKIHLGLGRQDVARVADLQHAVAASDGFVPSEIKAAVEEAVMQAFKLKRVVDGPLISEQLGRTKKLSEAFAEEFRRMEEWATNNARPASSDPRPPAVRQRSRTAPVVGSTASGARGRSITSLPGDVTG